MRAPSVTLAVFLFICGTAQADPIAEAFASLPDFSHAGYACGEQEPPVLPVAVNVCECGAKGDGQTDDNAAFEKALGQTQSGAVLVPAGVYCLSRPLVLNRSGVVLRGAGRDQTTLRFTRSLTDIAPQPTFNSGGTPTSAYSWSGGMLQLEGKGDSKDGDLSAKVTAVSPKGARTLAVDHPETFRPGMEAVLGLSDPGDQSLARYLAGPTRESFASWKRINASQSVRIVKVEGKTLFLDRPLRFETRLAWRPKLSVPAHALTQAGVEDLTIAFPVTPYRGHFREVGFNAIAIGNAAHCWVRHLRITNADSGIFCGGRQCTLQDIAFTSQRTPDKTGCTGHHGILLGQDNLLSGFSFANRFIHDITVSGGSSGNVVENGRAADLALDHHCRGPYENLFCNLDAGAGTRLYRSGGGEDLGPHCGEGSVFWGIRAEQALPPPPAGWGPSSLLLVGVTREAGGYRVVPADSKSLVPVNPRVAQLKERLGKK